MTSRLPPELRNGLMGDILAWFMQCAGVPGDLLEPREGHCPGAAGLVTPIVHAGYRSPHSPIGTYMDRWWFLPELFGERARIHRTLRSDHGRDLHDHPWHFVSVILEGGYTEELDIGPAAMPPLHRRRFRAGDVLFRHAEHRHRLELDGVDECWSLVFTAPNAREWGFWTEQGFVPWREYQQLEPA